MARLVFFGISGAALALADPALAQNDPATATQSLDSLVNAGQQSVRGFELDTGYRPVGWLSLNGGVTYLDPKYDSFTRAPCVNYDTLRCPLNPLTGQRSQFRDLSGATPAGLSPWSASASGTITHQFGTNIGAFPTVAQDGSYTGYTNRPRTYGVTVAKLF